GPTARGEGRTAGTFSGTSRCLQGQPGTRPGKGKPSAATSAGLWGKLSPRGLGKAKGLPTFVVVSPFVTRYRREDSNLHSRNGNHPPKPAPPRAVTTVNFCLFYHLTTRKVRLTINSSLPSRPGFANAVGRSRGGWRLLLL